MICMGFAKAALEVTGDGSLGAAVDDSYVGNEAPAPTRVPGYRAREQNRDYRRRKPGRSTIPVHEAGSGVLEGGSGKWRSGGEAMS